MSNGRVVRNGRGAKHHSLRALPWNTLSGGGTHHEPKKQGRSWQFSCCPQGSTTCRFYLQKSPLSLLLSPDPSCEAVVPLGNLWEALQGKANLPSLMCPPEHYTSKPAPHPCPCASRTAHALHPPCSLAMDFPERGISRSFPGLFLARAIKRGLVCGAIFTALIEMLPLDMRVAACFLRRADCSSLSSCSPEKPIHIP